MRIAKGAELCTAAVGACDEPTDAVCNSGRTWDVILCGQLHWHQPGEVRFVRRRAIQARMRAMRVSASDAGAGAGAGHDSSRKVKANELIMESN